MTLSVGSQEPVVRSQNGKRRKEGIFILLGGRFFAAWLNLDPIPALRAGMVVL